MDFIGWLNMHKVAIVGEFQPRLRNIEFYKVNHFQPAAVTQFLGQPNERGGVAVTGGRRRTYAFTQTALGIILNIVSIDTSVLCKGTSRKMLKIFILPSR